MTKLNNFTELIALLTCTNHLHVHANQQRNYVSMVTQTCGRINEKKRNRLDLTPLIKLINLKGISKSVSGSLAAQ